MGARSPEAIRRRLSEGRGSGEGAAYRPWLGVRDVPSHGLTTRLPGRKTGRQHVVLSRLERACLLLLQRLDAVVDIQEQFPLPREDTLRIASRLGVRHPAPPGGGQMLVTTDFRVTRRARPDGPCRIQALAVKKSDALADERTLEKLEVERSYAAEQGWAWGIVTEKELPEGLVANLEWLDACHDILPEALSPAMVAAAADRVLEAAARDVDRPMNLLCADVDAGLGLEPGTCLTVVGHMLARKAWAVDLARRIDFDAPLPALAAAGPAPCPAR